MRPDLQRFREALDKAATGAVAIDSYGDAWQKSGYLDTWYRAYSDESAGAFELAQRGPGRIVHRGDER